MNAKDYTISSELPWLVEESPGPLLLPHGGYRKLKSFQLAQLAFDLTVRFCARFVSKFSRTHDQMVQAARSGVQNIAEGSQASGTSKKTEIKLTNVARASLEELRLDYEDFLRQRDLPLWPAADPRRKSLVDRRCQNVDEVARWAVEMKETQKGVGYEEIAANAAHVIIGVACSLLDRQILRLAEDFETKGGFTERLYHTRTRQRP